jgi:hypothetical protein
MGDNPKRDMDERHKLPVDDAEEAIKAVLKVDPDAEPELSDADIEKIVRGALTDPELDDD